MNGYLAGVGLAILLGIAIAHIIEVVADLKDERELRKDAESVAQSILNDPALLALVLYGSGAVKVPECDDLQCGRCRACESFDDYIHAEQYRMTDEEMLLQAFPNAVEVTDHCPPHGIPRP